jgi:DDE superfamily endonuclease
VQKRPAKRNRYLNNLINNFRVTIEEEIENYRKELEEARSKRLHGKVYHMDETGLWNDSVQQKSYSKIGVTPMENTIDDHGRDTLVLTCREDGLKLDAFFIGHKKKKYRTLKNSLTGEKIQIVTDRGISGMNNDIMMKWAKWFVAQKEVKTKQDILSFDQHRSHLNNNILTFLRDSGLEVIPFPKGSAANLSMLDNSLFKDYKHDFNKEWIKNERDLSKKKEIAMKVWEKFPGEKIRNYWKKCGYPVKSNRKIRNRKPGISTNLVAIRTTVAKSRDIRNYFKSKYLYQILNNF